MKLNHPSVLKYIGYSPIDFEGKYRPVVISELMVNKNLRKIIEYQRKYEDFSILNETKKVDKEQEEDDDDKEEDDDDNEQEEDNDEKKQEGK